MTLYVDGASQGTHGSDAGDLNINFGWSVGRASHSGSYYFDGLLDEMTIWNGALTLSEVQALSTGGSPNDPLTHSRSSNLIHNYRFGDLTDTDGSSSVVYDRVASGTINLNSAGAPAKSTDVA